jgi:hypothetical protein
MHFHSKKDCDETEEAFKAVLARSAKSAARCAGTDTHDMNLDHLTREKLGVVASSGEQTRDSPGRGGNGHGGRPNLQGLFMCF